MADDIPPDDQRDDIPPEDQKKADDIVEILQRSIDRYFDPDDSEQQEELREVVEGISSRLSISDVQRNVHSLSLVVNRQLSIRTMAAVELLDGSRIPANMEEMGLLPGLGAAAVRRWLRQRSNPGFDEEVRSKFGLVRIDVEEASSIFFKRLKQFLGVRVAATRRWDREDDSRSVRATVELPRLLGLVTTSVHGCNFEVNADTAGLRAHWSGAYYISGNLFGRPTSPVKSQLMAGIYVFGVDHGPYPTIQWDTATKVTLPGPNTSIHLNY